MEIPPDGAISAASARLLVEGDGLMTPIPSGMVELETFGLSATVSATVLGQASLWGVVAMSRGGPLEGTLTSGLNATFPNDFILNLSASVGCNNLGSLSACTQLELPLAITGPQTLSPLGFLAIGNLATIGSATIMAALPITLGGLTGVLTLVGSEISRELPEPGGHAGAATALLVLAAVRLMAQRPKS